MLHFETISDHSLVRFKAEFKLVLDKLNHNTRSDNPGIAAIQVLLNHINVFKNPHLGNKFFHYLGQLAALEDMGDSYSYTRILKNESVFTYFNGAHQQFNVPAPSMMEQRFRTSLIYHLASHFKAGNWAYQLSQGLAQALKETELRGLMTDDIQLPYPAIYLDVPETVGFKVWNDQSGWHNLVGIYIVEDQEYLYTLDGKKIDSFDNQPTCRAWRFLLVGEDKQLNVEGSSLTDDALSFFQIALFPGQSLDMALKKFEEKMISFQETSIAEAFRWANCDKIDYWIKIFKWAMNAMLYATNVDKGREITENREVKQLRTRIAKLKNGKKKKGLQLKLKSTDPRRRVLLGENIVVNRNDQDVGMDVGKKPHSNGQKLTIRVKIPGHWRRVCYGKDNLLRRWQHINSYWKGPVDGIFKPKTHLLK